MTTVATTVTAHLHRPEPGSATVSRLSDTLVIVDLTGGQLGSPDISAMFGSWEAARLWAQSLVDAIDVEQIAETGIPV